jgi:hypothetical protein
MADNTGTPTAAPPVYQPILIPQKSSTGAILGGLAILGIGGAAAYLLLKPKVKVTLSASPTTVTGSGTVAFTATVMEGTTPVDGASVSFYDNGGSTLQGTGVTDSSGTADFSYTYSSIANSGTDTWVAIASSTSIIGTTADYTSNSVAITLTSSTGGGGGQVASISLAANPTTVQAGGTVDFQAVAYNDSNQPVEGASLVLYEETTGTTSSPATTDSTGTAAWSVTFPDTTEPGNYVFVAESD